MKRFPAVAGQFYPHDAAELEAFVRKVMEQAFVEARERPVALISPHAGYIYSGQTAAYSYKLLSAFDFKNAIIISPNHTGLGVPVSIFPEGEWITPLGSLKVNEEIAKKIASSFKADVEAHLMEHAIEVQLPFLQVIRKDVKIVPITVMDQSLDTMKKLGKVLASCLNPKTDIVIASTDFSHYIPDDEARERDSKAISAIERLDEDLLYEYLKKYDISMCGYGGVAAAMLYAKEKNAKKAKLLYYDTSATASGDKSAVVGYAAMYMY